MASALDDFCYKLARISFAGSKNQYALALLVYYHELNPSTQWSSNHLAKVLQEHSIANLNSSRLAKYLSEHPGVSGRRGTYSIKSAAVADVVALFPDMFQRQPPTIDQGAGYLPEGVWKGTRPYVEHLATEINGCVHHCYFNGAAVLIRRLVETLLIESYRHLGQEEKIRDGSGNYYMLSKIIVAATASGGLPIGREAKTTLGDVKALGDRSAHNLYFLAKEGDLKKIESGLRVTVDELLMISGMRAST